MSSQKSTTHGIVVKGKLLGKITKEGRQVELSIDGQCDTPGHNVTYCTVSSMDIHTNKIIDFNVVDVKEVRNSQG